MPLMQQQLQEQLPNTASQLQVIPLNASVRTLSADSWNIAVNQEVSIVVEQVKGLKGILAPPKEYVYSPNTLVHREDERGRERTREGGGSRQRQGLRQRLRQRQRVCVCLTHTHIQMPAWPDLPCLLSPPSSINNDSFSKAVPKASPDCTRVRWNLRHNTCDHTFHPADYQRASW